MRVAIVEDDRIQAETLKKYVDDYRRTHDYGTGETLVFGNGETFLGYCEKNSVDIVFMDIVMPGMDGMTVCEKIRERNSSMIIVFVTDMAQFAVRGYKVDALDYIVKPVTEGGFRLAMDRAFRKAAGRAGAVISVRNGLGNRTSGGRTRGKRGRQRGNGTCGGRRRIRIPQPQALCSIIPIYSFSCSPHLRENPALILYIIISVRSDKVKYPDKRAGRPCDTAHVRIFAAVPTSFIRTAAAKPSARKQRVIRRRFCALRHSPMKS